MAEAKPAVITIS